MAWIPAAIAGGASLLGGIMGNKSSAKEAQKNRDFQEDMSNTSYQRAVADMKAAGINPMLSAKVGGASTPSGSQAEQRDVVTPAANSAMSAYAQSAQVENVQAQTGVSRETERELRLKNDAFDMYLNKLKADTGASEASAGASRAQARNLDKLTEEAAARINVHNATVAEKRKALETAEAQIRNLNMSTDRQAQEIQLLRVQIAGHLTDNEAKALNLSFEKEYGARYREAGLKAARGEADTKAVEGAKALRSFDVRGAPYGPGTALDNLRELIRAFKGGD